MNFRVTSLVSAVGLPLILINFICGTGSGSDLVHRAVSDPAALGRDRSPYRIAQHRPVKPAKPAGPRRLAFAEARKLLASEAEGNLDQRSNSYTRTRLSDGRVLELYYPVAANQPTGKRKTASVPGYGVLYESGAAYREATRPRHALEELIPDARDFVARVPQLVARLEQRLRLKAGALDYSRASLKRVDGYLAAYQQSHSTAETDAKLFQELTAYYGETLRRTLNGEWRVSDERVGKTHVQSEPNLVFVVAGRTKIIKLWNSVLNALYDEEKRGGLTKAFDADARAAQ